MQSALHDFLLFSFVFPDSSVIFYGFTPDRYIPSYLYFVKKTSPIIREITIHKFSVFFNFVKNNE